MTKLRILMTNDDGIHAPGIRHLWHALREIADVTVVAPDREQSAVGLSITVRQPLRVEEMDWEGHGNIFAVNGTPADCIKIAVNVVLDQKPDLILSGLNRGSNAGRNVLYSGTVAAAIEGTMHDIPSIALSCYDYHDRPDYPAAAHHVPQILNYINEHPLPRGSLLNVNFPSSKLEVQGFKLTSQGMEYWAENMSQRQHPAEGHDYYWLGAQLRQFEEDTDSDVVWLRKGFITAVPVQVHQLTHQNYLNEKSDHFAKLEVHSLSAESAPS